MQGAKNEEAVGALIDHVVSDVAVAEVKAEEDLG